MATGPSLHRLYAINATSHTRLFNAIDFGLRLEPMISRESIVRALRRSPSLVEGETELCPVCGTPLEQTNGDYESVTHNSETCRLVNLVLSELGINVPQAIRVNIYPGAGALRGFYFTADPYTINISEEAYSQIREYIIFHETKHLVDCLQFGRSEEVTPDRFARALCQKYGYRCPPENPVSPWFAYA
jgi:RNA polymerase subunit RPABC4/transcription elongation factor Spt4